MLARKGQHHETVRPWDVRTGEERQKLTGHGGWVKALAFSLDWQFIVSASENGMVRLWDARTGKERQRLEAHLISRLEFADDGKSLETNVGSFDLAQGSGPLLARKPICASGPELRDQWIRHKDEDLLWLPYEYRGECSDVHRNTLVIGQVTGGALFFGFNSEL